MRSMSVGFRLLDFLGDSSRCHRQHVLHIYSFLKSGKGDSHMEEYRAPKLIGKKALMNCLALPDQHYQAWLAAQLWLMNSAKALARRAAADPDKC